MISVTLFTFPFFSSVLTRERVSSQIYGFLMQLRRILPMESFFFGQYQDVGRPCVGNAYGTTILIHIHPGRVCRKKQIFLKSFCEFVMIPGVSRTTTKIVLEIKVDIKKSRIKYGDAESLRHRICLVPIRLLKVYLSLLKVYLSYACTKIFKFFCKANKILN